MTEWLSNWLAVQLGPRTFALPYRQGRIHYDMTGKEILRGHVADARSGAAFAYQTTTIPEVSFTPARVNR